MAASSRHRGWYWDNVNTELEVYVDSATREVAFGQNAGLTIDRGGLTVTAGGATVTAGGLTVTAGGAVITAGDAAVTAGNVRLGAIETFGTTEPTSAVVMKTGTAPAGAITTSGGIFSSATVVRKIIAAGTVSNVET